MMLISLLSLCSLNLLFSPGREIELLSSSWDFYSISTLQTLMNLIHMFVYGFIFTTLLWKGLHYPPVPFDWEKLSSTTFGCFMTLTTQFFNNFAPILAVLESFIYSNHHCCPLCVCSTLENESSQPKLGTRKWRRQLPWSHLKEWPAQYKTRGRNKTSS